MVLAAMLAGISFSLSAAHQTTPPKNDFAGIWKDSDGHLVKVTGRATGPVSASFFLTEKCPYGGERKNNYLTGTATKRSFTGKMTVCSLGDILVKEGGLAPTYGVDVKGSFNPELTQLNLTYKSEFWTWDEDDDGKKVNFRRDPSRDSRREYSLTKANCVEEIEKLREKIARLQESVRDREGEYLDRYREWMEARNHQVDQLSITIEAICGLASPIPIPDALSKKPADYDDHIFREVYDTKTDVIDGWEFIGEMGEAAGKDMTDYMPVEEVLKGAGLYDKLTALTDSIDGVARFIEAGRETANVNNLVDKTYQYLQDARNWLLEAQRLHAELIKNCPEYQQELQEKAKDWPKIDTKGGPNFQFFSDMSTATEAGVSKLSLAKQQLETTAEYAKTLPAGRLPWKDPRVKEFARKFVPALHSYFNAMLDFSKAQEAATKIKAAQPIG